MPVNEEHHTDVSQRYPFTLLSSVLAVISMILFLVDIVTDIVLAIEYKNHGRVLECALTFSVVIMSFLVAGTLSTIWYVQDYHEIAKKTNREDPERSKHPVEKVIFLIFAFPFAVIIRGVSHFRHGCLSRRSTSNETRKTHYYKMIKEDRDTSLLRMFEAFLESAPQLILQIYLAMHDPPNKALDLVNLRSSTIISSILSIVWSLTSYYRALKKVSGVGSVTVCGGIGYFLWRLFEIGPRITAIVMLILVDSYRIGIIIGVIVHWIIMFTTAYRCEERVYEKDVHNYLFIAFISLGQIISFMSLNSGKSRYQAIFYYSIFHAENAAMVALFVLFTNMDRSSWIFITVVCVASSGSLFCSLFMVLYYKLCHPKIMRSDGRTEEADIRDVEVNAQQL